MDGKCSYNVVKPITYGILFVSLKPNTIMSLATYKTKRNFRQSPEPTGGKAGKTELRFVIQKHDATRLHYDFRLEMEGVLKSWAVPKGPSTDPSVKRLAMMVEDHPFDYRNFEGVIPSGYGAGTVIIWDEGNYIPADMPDADKKTQDKHLLKGLKSGKLHVVLNGKKLKGEYGLIKTKGGEENAWLMFKVKDKYVSTDDITLKDKSVISKKTIEQMEKKPTRLYGSNGRDTDAEKPSATTKKKAVRASKSGRKDNVLAKKTAAKKTAAKSPASKTKTTSRAPSKKKTVENGIEIEGILKESRTEPFPKTISPMLATLVDKPFDEEGWLYEVKWDGYRAVGLMKNGQVSLISRNDKSFNDKFYPLTNALKDWNINAVVDGEVVVLNEQGISNFGLLQNWRSEADGELYYYVFDLLWLDGKGLKNIPLIKRKQVLESLVPPDSIIRMSKGFEESGLEFFEVAKKIGLEGIIAKKTDSEYIEGRRTEQWLKIKANKRQEMVIGGYTRNNDTSKLFSALLVGVFEEGRLQYTGKVGTGFNEKTQREMLAQFKPLIIKTPPFDEIPDINKPSRFRPNPPHAIATWLKPELVCEVSFTEMTTDGIMRHPSFEGMRTDKTAKSVIMEKAAPAKKTVKKSSTNSASKLVTPTDKKQRKTLLNPTEETQVKSVNGHDLKFTNLSKLYWPKEKITKRDMINYYYQVAPFILPYLKDRPQSMNRHPDGITGQSFFFKDVTGKAPDWVETYDYHSEADHRLRKYLVAKDEASLLYMASLGCIEMNPWHSKVQTEDFPDWCIIDLDPAENTFDQVIEAALVTKNVLDSMGVMGYPKTSGSTGIHIYIPLGAKYSYEQSKEFARVIAHLVQREIPSFTSIERIVSKRKGKMYIDFLQNRPQATVSAPYSLRPKPGATVSMPLYWEEVKKGMKMSDFNIYTAMERLHSEGDIFKPVIGKGINLDKIIKTFEK